MDDHINHKTPSEYVEEIAHLRYTNERLEERLAVLNARLREMKALLSDTSVT